MEENNSLMKKLAYTNLIKWSSIHAINIGKTGSVSSTIVRIEWKWNNTLSYSCSKYRTLFLILRKMPKIQDILPNIKLCF